MDYPGKKTDEARDKAAQKALDSVVKKHKRLKKGQKLIQAEIPKMRATDSMRATDAVVGGNPKEDAYFKEYNSKDFPPSPKFKDVVKMAKKKKKK